MLDLYAVAGLDPWPDDLPDEREPLGSLDQAAFAAAGDAIARCLGEVGIVASFSDDWIVPAPLVEAAIGALRALGPVGDELRSMLERADGRMVLAVCD